MAKKRRRSRRGARRRVSSRRRRRAAVLLVNPRRRHHRRRRRNPGGFNVGAIAKDVTKVLIPGALAAGAMGFIDAKFLGDKALPVQLLGKLAVAGAAGYFLRKRPSAAYAAMGAILGGITYPMGLRAGGGVVAAGKIAGMRELAALASTDQYAMGILTSNLQGMGVLAPDMAGMGEAPSAPDLEGGDDSDDGLAEAMRAA